MRSSDPRGSRLVEKNGGGVRHQMKRERATVGVRKEGCEAEAHLACDGLFRANKISPRPSYAREALV